MALAVDSSIFFSIADSDNYFC